MSSRPRGCTVVNGFFHLCDTKGYLQQYKIPRTDAQAVTPELLSSTLRQAVIGGLTLQFPSAILLYKGMQHFGADMTAALPDLFTVYWQVGSAG